MDDAQTFETDSIHEENPAIQDRTVIAAFADLATANQAHDALNAAGYKDVDVTSGDPADDGKPAHEHGFWNKLKAVLGGHRHTPVYAEAVRRGNSLVTVHTEQGRASYAIDQLDRFAPIDIKGGEQAWIGETASQDPAIGLAATGSPMSAAEVSIIEEDLIIVEDNTHLGNDRVRSYVRNLPVVVSDQEHGHTVEGVLEAPTVESVKRAD